MTTPIVARTVSQRRTACMGFLRKKDPLGEGAGGPSPTSPERERGVCEVPSLARRAGNWHRRVSCFSEEEDHLLVEELPDAVEERVPHRVVAAPDLGVYFRPGDEQLGGVLGQAV